MSADAAQTAAAGFILGPDDPPPFEILNPGGSAPFLLVCDHASNRVPPTLDNLGLDEGALGRHIAIDIGAGPTTRELSVRLDATAVVATYSRLVIDNNRYLDDPTSIPEISDGTAIPGNRDLSAAQAATRADELFRPYHAAIDIALAALARDGAAPALISVHSFTPLLEGIERPWHVGLLWNRDRRIVRPLYEALSANRGIVTGENVPYSARNPYGFTVAEHADARGFPNVLIEIRQDLIDTHHGVETWSEILAAALGVVLKDDRLYREDVT